MMILKLYDIKMIYQHRKSISKISNVRQLFMITKRHLIFRIQDDARTLKRYTFTSIQTNNSFTFRRLIWKILK
jgi:hypothetical protein